VYFNHGYAIATARAYKVDTLGARYHLLYRGGDESLYQFGTGARVGCGNSDNRGFQLRILTHLGIEKRLHTEQHNHGADHQRQHRALDKEIG